MTFTCRCGHVAAGGIQFHCACGWHTKIQAKRCYGCGARIVLGNPEPVAVTLSAQRPPRPQRPAGGVVTCAICGRTTERAHEAHCRACRLPLAQAGMDCPACVQPRRWIPHNELEAMKEARKC